MSNFEVKSQSSPIWSRNGLDRSSDVQAMGGGYGYRPVAETTSNMPGEYADDVMTLNKQHQGIWRYSLESSQDNSRHDKLITENSALQNQVQLDKIKPYWTCVHCYVLNSSKRLQLVGRGNLFYGSADHQNLTRHKVRKLI